MHAHFDVMYCPIIPLYAAEGKNMHVQDHGLDLDLLPSDQQHLLLISCDNLLWWAVIANVQVGCQGQTNCIGSVANRCC